MRVQAGAVALAAVAAAMSAVVHGMASATAPAALHAVEKAPGATSVDVELGACGRCLLFHGSG